VRKYRHTYTFTHTHSYLHHSRIVPLHRLECKTKSETEGEWNRHTIVLKQECVLSLGCVFSLECFEGTLVVSSYNVILSNNKN
jgi:hypothetical protein